MKPWLYTVAHSISEINILFCQISSATVRETDARSQVIPESQQTAGRDSGKERAGRGIPEETTATVHTHGDQDKDAAETGKV